MKIRNRKCWCVITSYSIHYTKLYDLAGRVDLVDAQAMEARRDGLIQHHAPAAVLADDVVTDRGIVEIDDQLGPARRLTAEARRAVGVVIDGPQHQRTLGQPAPSGLRLLQNAGDALAVA